MLSEYFLQDGNIKTKIKNLDNLRIKKQEEKPINKPK